MAEKVKKEKKEKKQNGEVCKTRVCSVGGEALMEGIMMRCPSGYAQVVRAPDGQLVIETKRQPQFGAGNKFLSLPLVRGTIRLADSLIVGTKALFNSAEITASGDDPNYKPSKFDLWVEKKLGDKAMGVVMTLSLVVALVVAIGLFFFLPRAIVEWGIERIPGVHLPWLVGNILEGIIRMMIFIGYLALISVMKDVRRVFMYHGAEHKTIFCYEKYEELTVENVRKQSKHHPRCGTAFLFVVMIISILVHSVIPDLGNVWLNILVRILSLPVVAGIAYEFNRYAGSHENKFVRVLRAPGLLMQRFTTKEPDDSMIEVAIVALKEALKLDEMPDYSAKTPEIADKAADEAAGETAGETANEPSSNEGGAPAEESADGIGDAGEAVPEEAEGATEDSVDIVIEEKTAAYEAAEEKADAFVPYETTEDWKVSMFFNDPSGSSN